MRFRVKNNHVQLEDYREDKQTATGLNAVHTEKNNRIMKVIAVCDDSEEEFTVGDLVCLDRLNLIELKHNGETYYFINKQFIYAKIDQEA